MYLVSKVAETLEYYYCGYNKGEQEDVSFKHACLIEHLTS